MVFRATARANMLALMSETHKAGSTVRGQALLVGPALGLQRGAAADRDLDDDAQASNERRSQRTVGDQDFFPGGDRRGGLVKRAMLQIRSPAAWALRLWSAPYPAVVRAEAGKRERLAVDGFQPSSVVPMRTPWAWPSGSARPGSGGMRPARALEVAPAHPTSDGVRRVRVEHRPVRTVALRRARCFRGRGLRAGGWRAALRRSCRGRAGRGRPRRRTGARWPPRRVPGNRARARRPSRGRSGRSPLTVDRSRTLTPSCIWTTVTSSSVSGMVISRRSGTKSVCTTSTSCSRV